MRPGSSSAFFHAARSARLRLFVLALLIAGMSTITRAQDKVELFGGYSYFRASIREGQNNPCLDNCPIQTFPTSQVNLNGWQFSTQYKFLPFFGGVADFNGTYGKLHNASTREHTYLLGPQISLPTKFSPFAHVLFGFARESQDALASAQPLHKPPASLASDRIPPGPALWAAASTGTWLLLSPFASFKSIASAPTCTAPRKISRASPPASSSTSNSTHQKANKVLFGITKQRAYCRCGMAVRPMNRMILRKAFSFALPAEAPHDAALHPHAVLRSATEARVQILDLDRAQRNVPG